MGSDIQFVFAYTVVLYCKCIITGVAGQDYPNYHDIPKTNFECSGKIAGYYADTDARCQVSEIKGTQAFDEKLFYCGCIFNRCGIIAVKRV